MAPDPMSFELRYVGGRFEGKRLPVEVLSDLPAFRDLLVAFAKDQWRAEHDRVRVPKGFDKSITFDLVGITDGSAIPQLEWNRDIAQASLPGFSDQIEEIVHEAYSTVVHLFDEAGYRRFPPALSTDHIRALNRFGSGLQDDERIEFHGSKGHDGQVVYLDSFRRKELITHVKETYQTRVVSVGRLTANDYDGFINVDTEEFGEITIPVEPEKVKAVFDGYLNELVQFDVQIELDHDDKYRTVVEVFDAVLIDAEIGANLAKCRERLAELGALQAGWLNGSGAAIDPAVIAAAGRFLSKRLTLCGFYRIYPTEEGGVVFEFERGGWDLSVEFIPGGDVEIYGVELKGAGEIEPARFGGATEEFLAEFDRRAGRQWQIN